MYDFHVITNPQGKVLAVLMYATLAQAQELARSYSRILGVDVRRDTVRAPGAPAVGSYVTPPAPYKCNLCGQIITDGKPCGCGART